MVIRTTGLLVLALLSSFAQQASSPASYALGPGDEIVIRALNVDEIKETPIRLDLKGEITLPLIGKIKAGGLRTEELEVLIKERLKKYYVDPDVVVAVLTFRSQPVMVLGAVAQPGVAQIEGRKTLFEVISSVGGVRPDAGHTIKITRRKEWGRIPLPGCVEDPTGEFFVAEVAVSSVMEARSPAENILIQPRDVITVPKARIVYVIGAVKKSGGFTLGETDSMTVLQALANAEGLDRFAAPGGARILRVTPGSAARTEIHLDVKKIFSGKGTDVALGADDILFIPVSGKKLATARTIEAAATIGSGLAIYAAR